MESKLIDIFALKSSEKTNQSKLKPSHLIAYLPKYTYVPYMFLELKMIQLFYISSLIS